MNKCMYKPFESTKHFTNAKRFLCNWIPDGRVEVALNSTHLHWKPRNNTYTWKKWPKRCAPDLTVLPEPLEAWNLCRACEIIAKSHQVLNRRTILRSHFTVPWCGLFTLFSQWVKGPGNCSATSSWTFCGKHDLKCPCIWASSDLSCLIRTQGASATNSIMVTILMIVMGRTGLWKTETLPSPSKKPLGISPELRRSWDYIYIKVFSKMWHWNYCCYYYC